jgi:formate hydrogenlyase transcriptional activator
VSNTPIVCGARILESGLDQVQPVAPTDSTVLIEGKPARETNSSHMPFTTPVSAFGHPFTKLNWAAIPLDLMESELFGREKGAFTGAIAQKIGRFEMADKGTQFLDEVGDIPPALQRKLLRVLQEQDFERLGSGRRHKVDGRLVAATKSRSGEDRRSRTMIAPRHNDSSILAALIPAALSLSRSGEFWNAG